MYRILIRPILFLFSPETAHYFASLFLRLLSAKPLYSIVRSLWGNTEGWEYTCMGLRFRSRLGVAAGFDKNGTMYRGLSSMGFGFVEVGTTTVLPQNGNPKPRIFRLPEDESLINRLGFNNAGLDAMVRRLRNKPSDIIIGGNIGKNRITGLDEAWKDYEKCFRVLHPYVDYFTVNVSSPNTPELRELQNKEPLMKLLANLQSVNSEFEERRPLLLKISPDLSNAQLDDIVDIVVDNKLDGIVAVNTTISRKGLKTDSKSVEEIGPGGLSGKALNQKSMEIIQYLSARNSGRFAIIGVGGVFDAADAKRMIGAGADLIQVYTGFIYRGPSMVREINNVLAELSHQPD